MFQKREQILICSPPAELVFHSQVFVFIIEIWCQKFEQFTVFGLLFTVNTL
jgi:hypothetical protein